MIPSLNPSSFVRNPDVAWRVIEGEAVLVHNRKGEVTVLNSVGALVWESIDRGVEAAVLEVRGRYDVPDAEARADVAAFVTQLEAAGLLLSAEGAR